MHHDTAKPQTRGPGRTSREDWINTALDTLISDGIDSVKVLSLAQKLDCARSSFYWYFKNRSDLLDALLGHWQSTNTDALVASAVKPAPSIHSAIVNVYSTWISGHEFDTALDFAIRDWARRSGKVRHALDRADAARLSALAAMFERYSYDPGGADIRARIFYFTQIGYEALDQQETWSVRLERGRGYLYCMTGVTPSEGEVAALGAILPQVG
ncbi:MAG: TetR/AcrR family transcriptional regulator [Rhodobacteraceae bacterium]|nr:TetR/AcrR family transcriptional regulator [Paracoccaceae bacterium]